MSEAEGGEDRAGQGGGPGGGEPDDGAEQCQNMADENQNSHRTGRLSQARS